MSQRVSHLLAEGNVRGLCRLLRERDPIVRSQAAQALGQLADPAAVSYLAEILQGEADLHTQRHAIGALGAIGNHESVEALTHILYNASRMTARLAGQALDTLKTPEAKAALAVRDMLARSDWAALAALDEEGRQAFQPALGSPLFFSWVPGKQQRVLEIALALGLTPPRSLSRRLKGMGIFMGAIHTLGDVLDGLWDADPDVRIAAIQTLAKNKDKWVLPVLYWRFRREMRQSNMAVAAAGARELARLGDMRGVAHFKERLFESGDDQGVRAAKALAQIAIPESTEALFGFLVRSSGAPPRPSRTSSAVLSALRDAGPEAVEHLRRGLSSPNPQARRVLVDIIAHSGHPETVELLGGLARDGDPSVLLAAVESLGGLNTPDAARVLGQLVGAVPQEAIISALQAIVHPEAAAVLKEIGQIVVEVAGVLIGAGGQPIQGGRVQCVRERFLGEGRGWEWRPVGPHALTGPDGAFYLLLGGEPEGLHLKVTLQEEEPLLSSISLQGDRVNRPRVQVDRILHRLLIEDEADRE